MTDKERFLSKVWTDNGTGCWEWTARLFSGGYGQFWHNGTTRKASRVAWELFVGPIADGAMVLHKCNNRKCCNPDHLYLGDHAQNMRDKRAKGTVNRWEDRYNFKQSDEVTRGVLEMRKAKKPIDTILRELGIAKTTYYRIRQRIGKDAFGGYFRGEQ